MIKIVNQKTDAFDVYIGRGSVWGNKKATTMGGRIPAVRGYIAQIWEMWQRGEVTTQRCLSLDGKRLGCFCKPLLCHGDVLAIFVSSLIHFDINVDCRELDSEVLSKLKEHFMECAEQYIANYGTALPKVEDDDNNQLTLFE